MSENQVREQSYSATDRPGRRLADARKARGLSLEDVATRLRLNINLLQALENDDYGRLPPATYVSGYLRSYARLLGLNEAEINGGAFPAQGTESLISDVLARKQMGEVRASDPPVRLISYLIIGGLFFLSGIWWLGQEDDVPSPAVEVPVAAAHEEAVAQSIDPASAETGAEQGTDAPVADAALEPQSPEGAAPNSSTQETTAAAAPATLPPETKVEAPPKPQAPPPPPLTPETPQSKVTLETTEECWVNVVDAQGRQLAYELWPAGRKANLRGEAPFKVFLGYAPGIQVSFNDQPFDHRPYQRREIARFRLGTAEDNTLPTEAQ